jgi:serine/threonine protein phosphatase 1
MQRTFAIGDIHGRHSALVSVLSQSGFDKQNDTLITLGDTVDGGVKTRACIDTLLEIEHRVDILGNHDFWSLNWIKTGIELPIWVHQGGYATMESYGFNRLRVPEEHREFFEQCKLFYIDELNRVFVHGGFDPTITIEQNDPETIMWDRELCNIATRMNIPGYFHVYVGHTATQHFKKDFKPITFHNLTMLDTGAGWNGRLTIMNVDTGEYWQSSRQKPRKER